MKLGMIEVSFMANLPPDEKELARLLGRKIVSIEIEEFGCELLLDDKRVLKFGSSVNGIFCEVEDND